MWGFEPKCMDMYLADNADFIQDVKITNPETGEEFAPPVGTEVFFRIGRDTWPGTLDGSIARFKVESEVTDLIRRNESVQFCITVGTDDWVLTQGRIIRG